MTAPSDYEGLPDDELAALIDASAQHSDEDASTWQARSAREAAIAKARAATFREGADKELVPEEHPA